MIDPLRGAGDCMDKAANHGTEPAQVLIFQVSAPEEPFLVPTE